MPQPELNNVGNQETKRCPMRSAIATGKFFTPHETFVNRHIEHLFGGNTCVLSQKPTDHTRPNVPHLIWGDTSRFSIKKAARGPARAFSKLKYKDKEIPLGQQKKIIKEFLLAQRVSVVLTEFGIQAIRLSRIAEECGIPLITYFRGFDATSRLKKGTTAEAYRQTAPKIQGFIAVSQFLLNQLAAHQIVHPHSFVIPSGVDIKTFTPTQKIPGRCVAVGRMIEKKAPLATLMAFQKAAERHRAISLEMIGDGPLYEKCRTFVKEQSLGGQVKLHGALPHDKVREKMQRAEIFLQHSVIARDGNSEGLPTAIQEAMACGLAILSTRHAGISEAVIEGENGFLVNEWDIRGMQISLEDMIRDRSSLARMMQASRRIAEKKFDNSKLLRKTEDVLVDLVDRYYA